MGQAESRQKNSSIAIAEDSPSYDVNSADQIHPGLEYEDEQSSGFCCVTKTRPKTFDVFVCFTEIANISDLRIINGRK